MKPYKTLSKTILFENPWWRYGCDRIEYPSGQQGEYHYAFTNGSSMIVPVLDDGRLLLVRQYRYTGNRDSLEFPCGGVKDGTTHEASARSELREETGYESASMVYAGEFNPCNGLLNEICKVYVARNLRYVGDKPDETEHFEQIKYSPQELEAQISNRTIWDGMTLAAWALAKSRLP